MSTLPPTSPQTVPSASADAMVPSAISERPEAVGHDLTPYEAAAKAIFVKANGLSAYRKATGTAWGIG